METWIIISNIIKNNQILLYILISLIFFQIGSIILKLKDKCSFNEISEDNIMLLTIGSCLWFITIPTIIITCLLSLIMSLGYSIKYLSKYEIKDIKNIKFKKVKEEKTND